MHFYTDDSRAQKQRLCKADLSTTYFSRCTEVVESSERILDEIVLILEGAGVGAEVSSAVTAKFADAIDETLAALLSQDCIKVVL